MKEKIRNNLWLKILAVFAATFLWWTVVNIDDPIETKKYYTDVTVLNPEVVTNEGNSYEIIDNTKTVLVTVKARRKVLEQIKNKSIVATADMRELQGTSVPVRVSVTGFEGTYESATPYPQNIQVNIEATQEKTFPIAVQTSGSVRDGYVIGSVAASPKAVKISGPESIIGKISKVVAQVDVSELSSSTTIPTTLKYYDAADNEIDKSQLSSNCDTKGVDVVVTVWATKSVRLKFDTSSIIPGEGYVFDSIEVTPQTVEIAGSQETLKEVTMLEVGPEALVKNNIKQNEEVMVDITQYLPEGIILADVDAANVLVEIMLEKVGTKTINMPVRSIKVEGLDEKFQLNYGPEQSVSLVFKGTKEVLDYLEIRDVDTTIDLSACTIEGTYVVPVKVTKMPLGSSYTGDVTVEVLLSLKEETNNEL